MTVRKNFNFDETTARHLEELAREKGKTQTQIAVEAIESIYAQNRRQNKKALLNKLSGSVPRGSLVDVDVRAIRTEQAASHA